MAIWIWRLVEHYFPQATQIVDWYHASQYLPPIAEAAFGPGTPQAQQWLTQTRTDLWEGRIQEVIQACRTCLPHASTFAEKAISYYSHNENAWISHRQRHYRKCLQANCGGPAEMFWRTLDSAVCHCYCQSQSRLAF